MGVASYNSLVSVVSTTVCCSQRGGALLSIPRGQALLGGTADWDSVDAVCVPIAVTVIALAATITWCPNKDRAFPTTALQRTRQRENWGRQQLQHVMLCQIVTLQTYGYWISKIQSKSLLILHWGMLLLLTASRWICSSLIDSGADSSSS